MTFQPGKSGNPVGRPKGSVNKVTRTVRAAFEDVFNKLQEPDPLFGADPPWSLLAVAQQEPLEFYKLAKSLIPTKLEGNLGVALTVLTGVPEALPDMDDMV